MVTSCAGCALRDVGPGACRELSDWLAQLGVTDVAIAVKRGAMERLAPILMTALAAGLALIPLALSSGEPGSEIQAPMAIVILCGLLSSTALNMIVVPVLYSRFGSVNGKSASAA